MSYGTSGGNSDARYIPLRAGMGLREKREKIRLAHQEKFGKKKRILNGENQSDWGGNDFFLLFSTTFFDVARCEREMTKR